ncbi:MAG: acetate--CoA ligase family protein [bacterium]|nr:acetate--CoA ligase family protein [bacterium]
MRDIALDRLLAPSSIAVVGASERPSLGRTIIRSLDVLGYGGRILPVHPRNETVLGHVCHADIREIEGTIDAVAICLSRDRVMGEAEKAVARGAGAIVIYSGAFAEAGGEGAKDQRALVAMCAEAGVALCGPNCMGTMSLHNRSSLFMMDVVDPGRLVGNVGVISQSGSVSIGFLSDTRRFGFSHVISSGNEAATTAARYIDYLVDDPGTGVIALFAEAVREPERFVAALDRAHDAGKPVIVLKVGRSARAAAAVETHTGGLAGEARVLSAVLKAHRAIEVHDLEEMVEVLAVCQSGRRPQGDRLAVITGSGGHAGLALDLAEGRDLNLPPLPPAARQVIAAKVGSITGDGNPVDVWGQGDFAGNFEVAMRETSVCGAYDAVVVLLDNNDNQAVEYEGQDEAITPALIDAHRNATLPFYLMSARHGVMRASQVSELLDEGITTISGVAQGLGAITRHAEWSGSVRRCPAHVPPAKQPSDWVSRPSLHELDAKHLLAGTGMRITRSIRVATSRDAVKAARDLGLPVAMKAVGDRLPHRSEHGLVKLALAGDDAVREAFEDLERRLAGLPEADIVVQEMAPPGVEIIAGITRDSSFGLMLAVGPGGVLAELVDEVALACVPATDDELAALAGGRRLGQMLSGWRGAPPADRSALIHALEALSEFAAAHEPWLEGIDINPLIVHGEGEGCTVADALIVPRGAIAEPPQNDTLSDHSIGKRP